MAKIGLISAALIGLTSVVAAAEHLLEDLHARLQAAVDAGDDEGIQAILDSIEENRSGLAAAVAANTVADAEAPTPEPDPDNGGAEDFANAGDSTGDGSAAEAGEQG